MSNTQIIGIEANPDTDRRLTQYPSNTTLAERHLALHYLTNMWDGTGDVFENGTLLGGATRALAMGMQWNEKREADSQLHTYDWFSIRIPQDLPEDIWEILAKAGCLTKEEVSEAYEVGSFMPLFESLHKNEDYWPLIRPHIGYLPGHRGDVSPYGEENFAPPPDREFGLAFIDGCKSWYGTKYWFKELVSQLLPSSDLMFQDFGHYTCFWLPMLIGTFRDRFTLIAYVDHTYVWRLTNPPTPEEIEDAYPDEPTDLTRERFKEVLMGLCAEATERGDRWDVLATQMQYASACAYLGLFDESRETLNSLLQQAEWLPVRGYLKQARISPGYTPEGKILL